MKTSLFQKQNDYSSYTLDDRDGENFRCDLLRKKRKFFFYQKLFRFSLNLNPSKIYTSATITIPIYLHRSYISSHPWITLAHMMTQLKIILLFAFAYHKIKLKAENVFFQMPPFNSAMGSIPFIDRNLTNDILRQKNKLSCLPHPLRTNH